MNLLKHEYFLSAKYEVISLTDLQLSIFKSLRRGLQPGCGDFQATMYETKVVTVTVLSYIC